MIHTRTAEHYVAEIMKMIADDMTEQTVPRTVETFSDLFDHVDANEYMIQADVPWDPDNHDVQKAYVAVQDLVSDKLAELAKAFAEEEPDVLGAVIMGYWMGDFYSFTRTALGGARDWQVAGDLGNATYATVMEYTAGNRQRFIPQVKP